MYEFGGGHTHSDHSSGPLPISSYLNSNQVLRTQETEGFKL